MINTLWQSFCQAIADYYFYKGMCLGWNTAKGYKLLNKYHDWIDYKFAFTKED